ncbi:ABC transporter permease [Caballeronia sordidicola]|jgi:osmoprotectant transport system permease protein|uniref:ABC transporter permease n=1 Tax=Caballeronia sordidicola TaxID=196367 RepID=UPI000B78016B
MIAGTGADTQVQETRAVPVTAHGAGGLRIDKVGALIAALALLALVFEPFVTFRANRIVSGKGLGLTDIFTAGQAWAFLAVLATGVLFALLRSRPALRFVVGVVLLLTLCLLLGLVPAHLVTADNPLARVSPAGGFWILFFAFSVLVTDAIAKLSFGPVQHLLALALAAAAIAAILSSGLWSGLSVMLEYANHADTFWLEAARHIELVTGSVAAAVLVGVPLGVACAKWSALRAVALPVLNIVQTIPSIAMYGLMMVPLGLLAARFPLLDALGIRGIGVAPAGIALFLYSLLPVAASVVVGFAQLARESVEAAVAMGMTPRQRLFAIELPLALPVILTGVRIVLVQNIGLATVAALIGGGGFGTFVFQGLGQAATDLVLLGAVPTIALGLAAAIVFNAVTELAKRRH